jgi:probable HAF family extracellular repeat protein
MNALRNNVIPGGAVRAVLLLAAPAEADWVVTEIPKLPGWTGGMEATDINSNGVVCGNGNYVVSVSSTPFRFDGTTVTELPPLTPADPISLARGINVHGIVCGQSHRSDGKERAVYWEDTTLHVIPYAPDCNTNSYSQALGINDSGVIVGFYWNTNGERTAFYYEDGTTHSLDATIRAAGLTGLQIASGINNQNVICGSANDPFSITTPWLYDIDSGILTVLSKIGTDNCSASAINRSGELIGRGRLNFADSYHALYYDGTWHLIDATVTATQYPGDINNRGRMVGSTYIGSNNRSSWYSDGPGDGSMIPLDLPGWPTVTAMAINNDDWIVGHGETPTSGGESRAFIYAPPPGDADHDGSVGLDDYAGFVACLSGPKEAAGFVSPSAACLTTFEFDPADGDIDLGDFAAFQRAFEGS